MIGQTVINVKSGGRSRLSTLVAGNFLLFLIIALGSVVKVIPMAALVGGMIMVSVGTFDWNSLRTLHKVPLGGKRPFQSGRQIRCSWQTGYRSRVE